MRIDTTKIENYATMSAEEKLAALESFEHDAPTDDSADKYKKLMEKSNSEAADWKKKYNSKLTEDEQKEAERAAEIAKVIEERDALRKESTVSRHKADFMGLGYDEKLATDTAKALADGDMAKVFANQKIYIDTVRKSERASVLADGNEPPAGQNKPPKAERDKLIEQYNEAEKRRDVTAMFALEEQINKIPKE